jgi:tetratricopeptide (TPR) repeat protein
MLSRIPGIPVSRWLAGFLVVLASCSADRRYQAMWASSASLSGKSLSIIYPADSTLFPPEIPPPTIRWTDRNPHCNAWIVAVLFAHEEQPAMYSQVSIHQWRPDPSQWREMKSRSMNEHASISVIGFHHGIFPKALSRASTVIATSPDSVGAPLFYREVNLPFADAVKDPSRIRWRFGTISHEERPPVVLQNLPVCGNCHSFSRDGSVLGMDVDYANDKGAYAITALRSEIVLDKSKIITWNDYRKEDKERTYGLLSQVSPDGRYVISTVKDRSVFVPFPNLMFSQLFFPVKGILAFYDRRTKRFAALPGADDRRFVNSNATWSPDGNMIVFTRAPAYDLRTKSEQVLLSLQEVREFALDRKPFRYDLYRVPFNSGRGGIAIPLPGASDNGKSNYFARYSPDGKWIVFCQAKSYSLLQPDSRLYIMPAQGGAPRLMRCNTACMNSWHSFSPNGRWMVFSTKVNGPYTQLALTHIDEYGQDTPPVILDNLTAPDRAANIPEFVDVKADALRSIIAGFLDDHSFARAAETFLRQNDERGAEAAYARALEINPRSMEALNGLSHLYISKGAMEKAAGYCQQALAIDPDNTDALTNRALIFEQKGEFDSAQICYRRIIVLKPSADAYFNLGNILDRQGKSLEAIVCYQKAINADPSLGEAHYNLALILARKGNPAEASEQCAEAVRLMPDNAGMQNSYGVFLEQQGRRSEAISHYYEALRLQPDFKEARENWERVSVKSTRSEVGSQKSASN